MRKVPVKKNGLKINFAVVFLCLYCSFNLQAQSSMFGINAAHSGLYSSNISSNITLAQKWKFKTNGRVFSTPAIVNNVVYIGSEDSCVYALSIEGSLKWKFKGNGPVQSSPAVKDTVVYFNDYSGMLHALKTNNGQEIWNYQMASDSRRTGKGLIWCTPKDLLMEDTWDFYQSSPVYTDTILYVGSNNFVYAFNLKTHQLLWKFDAPEVVHSTPAISDGILYFGCWDSKVYALDAKTGALVWGFQTGIDNDNHGMEGIQSSPSVHDSIVLIGSRDNFVYALHAKTGKKIWQQSFGGSWMPSSFAVKDGKVYTGSSDAMAMYALDLKNGNILYKTVLGLYAFSSPALTKELAFIGSFNGSLFAIDINTGKIKSRFDTDGRKTHANIINANGTLNRDAFNDVNNTLYSSSVEFVKRLLSAGSVLSSPVVNGNIIVFGSTDSCIYAVSDNGACYANIKLSTGNKDLGNITSLDTIFNVINTSDCQDSLKIFIVGNGDLMKSTTLFPADTKINPQTGMQIKMHINTSALKNNKRYTAYIILQSKSNVYNADTIAFSFTQVVTTSSRGTNLLPEASIYPNPFSTYSTIQYSLICPMHVKISIYNVVGMVVKTLVDTKQSQGVYTTSWDATSNSGEKVSTGAYFCLVENDLGTKSYCLLHIK